MKREIAPSPKKKMTLIIEDEDVDSFIVSPRDPATGQASGKRSSVGTGIGPDMEPDMDPLETMT
jgi:C4-type Zn-finger protein